MHADIRKEIRQHQSETRAIQATERNAENCTVVTRPADRLIPADRRHELVGEKRREIGVAHELGIAAIDFKPVGISTVQEYHENRCNSPGANNLVQHGLESAFFKVPLPIRNIKAWQLVIRRRAGWPINTILQVITQVHAGYSLVVAERPFRRNRLSRSKQYDR